MKYKNRTDKDNWRNIKRIKNSINIFKDEVSQSDLQTFRNYVRFGEQKKAMVTLYLIIEDLKNNTYSLFGYLWKKQINFFGFTESKLLKLFYVFFGKETYNYNIDIDKLKTEKYQQNILEVEKEITTKERKEIIKEKIKYKYTYGYVENKRVKARLETYKRVSKYKTYIQIIYRHNKNGRFIKQHK